MNVCLVVACIEKCYEANWINTTNYPRSSYIRTMLYWLMTPKKNAGFITTIHTERTVQCTLHNKAQFNSSKWHIVIPQSVKKKKLVHRIFHLPPFFHSLLFFFSCFLYSLTNSDLYNIIYPNSHSKPKSFQIFGLVALNFYNGENKFYLRFCHWTIFPFIFKLLIWYAIVFSSTTWISNIWKFIVQSV